jgi:hypothetical protein
MDVSIVASIGSFAVSERILKPKATLLVILGLVLCYDLTTKTHDVSSLRVYRGKYEFNTDTFLSFCYLFLNFIYPFCNIILNRPSTHSFYANDVRVFAEEMAEKWGSL